MSTRHFIRVAVLDLLNEVIISSQLMGKYFFLIKHIYL